MYLSELNDANPVAWKAEVDFCPPDCGGKEFDEIKYYPFCPKCDKRLDDYFSIPNFCPNCGTKLWKRYREPIITEADE